MINKSCQFVHVAALGSDGRAKYQSDRRSFVADNIVRGGAVIDSQSGDANVQGVREFFHMLSEDPRLEATAIQTVCEKGWDRFAIAVVKSL